MTPEMNSKKSSVDFIIQNFYSFCNIDWSWFEYIRAWIYLFTGQGAN